MHLFHDPAFKSSLVSQINSPIEMKRKAIDQFQNKKTQCISILKYKNIIKMHVKIYMYVFYGVKLSQKSCTHYTTILCCDFKP